MVYNFCFCQQKGKNFSNSTAYTKGWLLQYLKLCSYTSHRFVKKPKYGLQIDNIKYIFSDFSISEQYLN